MSIYKGNNLISGAMPNSANQSLSNLNSAGQDKFDGKVNKSGDTMTGTLTVSTADQDQIVLVEPQTTKGTNPSAIYYTGIYFNDSQNLPQSSWKDTRLAFIEHSLNDAGVSALSMGAVQNAANGAAASYSLRVDSSGNASCSFPKTTCCDGQYVQVGRNIVTSSVSLNGSSILSYTLSEIANKGYNHMALITATISTGSASGNYCNLEITTDIMSASAYITRVKTQAASTQITAGSVWVPVSTSGKIYFYRNTNWHGTLDLLRFVGYRRIGTNA